MDGPGKNSWPPTLRRWKPHWLRGVQPRNGRGHSHPSHATVLADADAVAVQPHSHTPVGIAGMDEVLGHVEVFAHDAREHVVGFLVGRIGSPVRECQHLTFAYRIDQQRRIMPLHNQPIP